MNVFGWLEIENEWARDGFKKLVTKKLERQFRIDRKKWHERSGSEGYYWSLAIRRECWIGCLRNHTHECFSFKENMLLIDKE